MPDESLTIRWNGGEYVASPGLEVSVGRDRSNTIVLNSNAVSRNHGTFVHDARGWEYRDLGSTQGSFVGGRSVTSHRVGSSDTITLGQGETAVSLMAENSTGSPPPATELPPTAAAPDEALTSVAPGRPVAGQARPGGALAAGGAAATVIPPGNSDDALTVATPHASRTIQPGTALTIGREDDNDLVMTEAAVSRHHARIVHTEAGWELVDLGSSAGTWLDGTRVERVALTGRQRFLLGERNGTAFLDTDTGTAGGAVPSSTSGEPAASGGPGGEARSGSRTTAIIAAVAAAAVVLAAVGFGFWWFKGRGDPLDALARGTVQVASPYGWAGSGTIIDKENGLILTNAHVAQPGALGTGVRRGIFPEDNRLGDLAEKPFVISVSSGKDKSAEPKFTAVPVAYDGYLDLAVLKIDKTVGGAQISAADLESLTEIPISTGTVSSGDEVTVIGYPGAANSLNPTFTEGVVSGFIGDDRLKLNQAKINVDALVNAGNSGGLAVDAAHAMIGVPSSSRYDDDGNPTGINQLIPVSLAAPLIQAAKSGGSYTTPWTKEMPAGAKVTAMAAVKPGIDPVGQGCTQTGADPQDLAIGVQYEGFPVGDTTDVMVQLRSPDGSQILAVARSPYPTKLEGSGCFTANLELMDGVSSLPASMLAVVGVGGNYEVVEARTWTLGTVPQAPGTGEAPAPGTSQTAPPAAG